MNNKKKENVLILRLEGRLDALSAPEVEKILLGYIAEGKYYFLLDFSSVQYMTSAGMRMLFVISKRLKSFSGAIIFFGVAGNVMDILKLSGFDHIFQISKSEVEALSSFHSMKS